jgi:hypothetical protein
MKKLVVLFLLPLGTGHAEPGALTQYLMQEPATLFDIGMMRLENLTTEFENRVGLHWTGNAGTAEFFKAEINSDYDPTDDRIYVSFLIMNSEATYSQMEEGCGVAFRQMGIWLGKGLTTLFSHVGREDPSKPENLSDKLSEMLVMTSYVSSARSTAEGRFRASHSLQNFLQGRPMSIGPR